MLSSWDVLATLALALAAACTAWAQPAPDTARAPGTALEELVAVDR